jgi:hypothetical protein
MADIAITLDLANSMERTGRTGRPTFVFHTSGAVTEEWKTALEAAVSGNEDPIEVALASHSESVCLFCPPEELGHHVARLRECVSAANAKISAADTAKKQAQRQEEREVDEMVRSVRDAIEKLSRRS